MFTSVQRSVNERPANDVCTLVHYSCPLFFAYFTLGLFSCCIFSRVASCWTRFKSHFFVCCTHLVFDFIRVALFLYCTLFKFHFFVLYTFRVALFSFCTFFEYHFFRVVHFSCCTCFVLYRFHVEFFVCCTPFMLQLFSCCLMLHYVNVGIQASNSTKKRLHHKCFLRKL